MGGGNKGYFKDTTARDQISVITNLIDTQEINVTYPSSGTNIQKAQAIVTDVYSALTIKKPFTIVNINDENGRYRAEMLISELSSNYSVGLFMCYYLDYLYRVKNVNGTITVKQLAEV